MKLFLNTGHWKKSFEEERLVHHSRLTSEVTWSWPTDYKVYKETKMGRCWVGMKQKKTGVSWGQMMRSHWVVSAADFPACDESYFHPHCREAVREGWWGLFQILGDFTSQENAVAEGGLLYLTQKPASNFDIQILGAAHLTFAFPPPSARAWLLMGHLDLNTGLWR